MPDVPLRKTAFVLLALLGASCGSTTAEPVRIAGPTSTARIEASVDALDERLSDVPGRPPTAAEERAIGALLRLAEEIRDLRFERPVPFRIQSREVITQFVRDQIDPAELERSRVFYMALGLLAPDLDVEDMLVRVLGEQIVGYYDPDRSLMVVRDDVAVQLGRTGLDRELGEAEMVIVHELVHALQDQRLELGENFDVERSIDGDNAFASLVEGDATLAMIGHMAGRAGQPLHALTRNAALLRTLVRSNPQAVAGEEIERAPPIVRVPLVSRYLDGMVFCATLHGQRGWLAVDDAHRRPPESTEQVLHPERYLAGDTPIAITLPALPGLAAAGLTPHDEDTLGELEMGIWFAQSRTDGAQRDHRAAEGWGGDRLRVYRDETGRTSVVWFTLWDDESEAREAEAAARSNAQHVERIGTAVLILRDLPVALHPPVRAAFAAFAAQAR